MVGGFGLTQHVAGQFTIELMYNDVHDLDPAGTFIMRDDPVGLQRYLSTQVTAGDVVDLALIRAWVQGEPRAVYRIDHKGRAIGVTSEAFGRAVWQDVATFGRLEHGFPPDILQGRVSSIETVAGSAAAEERGLGPSGIWLIPQIYGLADVDWGELW